jgi:tetratricopeptide (TPR) repeat protein
VLSAHSVAHAGSQSLDIPSIARNLGVQVVFEGTVREVGNRIRVAARVISADGFQLWSQRLDAEADSSNLLALQEQFASALVSRVRPQLSFVRTADASVSQILLAAYPAVLKGESLFEDGATADIHEALARFREVEQSTPGYPRVFCGISRCQAWMALHGARRSHEHVAQARTAAEMAMKLDPQMTESLIAMGTVHGLEWQWEAAEENCLKAAEQRSHAAGNRQFAVLSTQLGRFDQAGLHLERAHRIDPFSYQQKTAWASFFYLSRRFEEASQHFTEPLRYGPVPRDARLYLASIYAELGSHDTGRQIAKELQISVGADLPSLGWIAEVFARCQDRAAAEAIVEKFDLLSDGADLSRYRQARLAMALGIEELAIALLNFSYSERDAELPYVAVEPRFDPIRQLPQFADLVRRVRSAGAE